MSVLYKAGVWGDPHPMVQKGWGDIHDKLLPKGYDLVKTSCRDGNHGAGTLHRLGAEDARPVCWPGPEAEPGGPLPFVIPFEEAREIVRQRSKHLQLVDERSKGHYHLEYDPPESAQ